MERRFLKQIAEGYLVDHDVYGEFKESESETIHNTVLNELNHINDYIYDVDIETYNEVREMSKLEQQRVFEIYLDMMFAKKDEINEVMKYPGPANPTWGQKSSDQKWSSTTKATLSGGLAAALLYLSRGIGNTSQKVPDATTISNGGGLFSALGTAADKTFEFLVDLLDWIPTPGWVLLLAAAVLKRKKIAKKTFEYLAGLGKIGEKLGKFIEKKGRYAKFRYAVIQKNRDSCYKRCGITNLENMGVREYLNKFAGDKGPTNARCLSTCYINTEIEKVKLITRMYFVCLRQTGNFDRIKNMDTAKLMNLLKSDSHRQSSFGLASTCGEYYEEISEGMDKINDLIEFFFENRSSQREMKMALQKDIDDVKKDIATMDERELRKFRLST